MSEFNLHDRVRSTIRIDPRISPGTRGAVVYVHRQESLQAYEVEFFDQVGDTIDLRTVFEDEIESELTPAT